MPYSSLPPVKSEPKLELPHFPTVLQAVIFRLWEMVSAERIADVVETTADKICRMAEDMGLPPQGNTEIWREKGYISIIRSVWHLLPYDQLLILLGWEEEKLAFILKEDDFLEIKLGGYKPSCEKVLYRELTADEQAKTKELREVVFTYARRYDDEITAEPFKFFDRPKPKPVYNPDAAPKSCVRITQDWTLSVLTENRICVEFLHDFSEAFARDWGFQIPIGGEMPQNNIVCSLLKKDSSLPEEYHEIEISAGRISVRAAAPAGILRALQHLRHLALAAGGPFFKPGVIKRTPVFETRFIYSYCGLYGNVLDTGTDASFPDALLKGYCETGINGIWIQAVLYQLVEFPFCPQMSVGWERRMNNLNDLIRRAARYGIKVYLYLNEPRAMPHAFFKKYPDIRGFSRDKYTCMCTSSPRVQEYLRSSITSLCKRAPGLGGFFTITCSENQTNCYSHADENTQTCPRCKNRTPAEVIAELNSLIADTAARVDPAVKTFAWTWAWPQLGKEGMTQCIKALSPNVILMCTSEEQLDYEVAGIKNKVSDYTMSKTGPSSLSCRLWKTARETGHQTAAKIQLNNTWENSTVPYIPVYESIIRLMQNLAGEKVSHLMCSWTLGGYPSDNLSLASRFFFRELSPDSIFSYDMALKSMYGKDYPLVKSAVSDFCSAFAEFPFHVNTVYTGPQNAGVSNLLYEHPTGLRATMTCYSYDDLESWRSVYPIEVFKEQFARLSQKWNCGLEKLSGLPDCEWKDIAFACGAVFESSYHQICYIQLRDQYLSGRQPSCKQEILEIVQKELALAVRTYRIMLKNPCIGYEAANHYYTRSSLVEKMLNCCHILHHFGS